MLGIWNWRFRGRACESFRKDFWMGWDVEGGVAWWGAAAGCPRFLELLGEGFGGGSPFTVGAPEWVAVCTGRCAACGMLPGCSFRI